MTMPDNLTIREYKEIVESRNFIKHEEPFCDTEDCGETNPHRHGFSCFKTCSACGAICHPFCPAYKEGIRNGI